MPFYDYKLYDLSTPPYDFDDLQDGSFVYFANDITKWQHAPSVSSHYGFVFVHRRSSRKVQIAYIASFGTNPPDYSCKIREIGISGTLWTPWVAI